MKRNRRLFLLALAALLVLPFVLPSTAAADTIAQKRAHARAIMGELATLDVKMEKVVERYDAATSKLAAIKAHIAQNQHTLTVTRYNLQMAKSQLEQRVVAMYKQRPVELLDVIVATKSFSSMVDQLDMLNRVGTSDSTMVDSIGSYQTAIKAAQKSLVTDRTAAEQVVAQRATEKGRGRKRPRRAPVDAARRQGPDRSASRAAEPGSRAGRPEVGRLRAAGHQPDQPRPQQRRGLCRELRRQGALRVGRLHAGRLRLFRLHHVRLLQLRREPAAQRGRPAGLHDAGAEPARSSPATSCSSVIRPTTSASTPAAAA